MPQPGGAPLGFSRIGRFASGSLLGHVHGMALDRVGPPYFSRHTRTAFAKSRGRSLANSDHRSRRSAA